MLEDTNDIGFQAVEVKDGFGVEPGVWFRLALGGITGHKDFARDTGVIVQPGGRDARSPTPSCASSSTTATAPTATRRGSNTCSTPGASTSSWPLVEEKLGRKLDARRRRGAVRRARPFDRAAHIGVHPQKQAGLNWIGVVLPVGKLTAEQMRGLADIARELGDGDIRLTVWQNLLISGVPDEQGRSASKAAIEALGLSTKATSIRAGLVACTGNTGCKFAASDTKGHAEEIADWCEARVDARQPGQHPSHRLPPFLRAALHRRHRPDRRCKVADLRRRRHGRGLPRPCRRRLRPGRRRSRREIYRDVKAEDCAAARSSAC